MDTEQFWAALKSGEFALMVKESSKGKFLYSPKEVFHIMRPIFAEKDDIERFYCIFLNIKNKIIAIEKMFDGTIDRCFVYPREIVKQAITFKATAVILVHNHLSGDPEPSNDDKKITMKMCISLWSIDVHLHDHIIIGDRYYSMTDAGIIKSFRDEVNSIFSL
jgi:DNA repair protein RadC